MSSKAIKITAVSGACFVLLIIAGLAYRHRFDRTQEKPFLSQQSLTPNIAPSLQESLPFPSAEKDAFPAEPPSQPERRPTSLKRAKRHRATTPKEPLSSYLSDPDFSRCTYAYGSKRCLEVWDKMFKQRISEDERDCLMSDFSAGDCEKRLKNKKTRLPNTGLPPKK